MPPIRLVGDSSFGMKRSKGYTPSSFVPDLERALNRPHDGRVSVCSISGGVLDTIRTAIFGALHAEPEARVLASWQFNELTTTTWKYSGCPPEAWFHEVRKFAR